MPHRPVLILRTGSTLPVISARRGDFPAWFADAMALAADDNRVVDAARAPALPDPGDFRAVVITGSPAMVTDGEDWVLRAAGWAKQTVDAGVPVLGVCFGHHLLAKALGGEVGRPAGREIGTVSVRLEKSARDDLLFHALPGEFGAHVTHEEYVTRLPAGLARLGSTDQDPNAVFAVPGRRVWGVQFHPEFDADIMRGYLKGRRGALEREGMDVQRKLKEVREAPHARAVLHRFMALV